MFSAITCQCLFAHISGLFSIDRYIAAVRRIDPPYDIKQRGFSRTGRPEQNTDLTFVHRKINALQYLRAVLTASVTFF